MGDRVTFGLLAALGVTAHLLAQCASISAASLNLSFSQVGGTLLDRDGQGTGFTTRLADTGTGIGPHDPSLDIDTAAGKLLIRTGNNVGANQQFNGQVGLDTLEAIGVPLSTLGYTGTQDFWVNAVFDPLPATSGDNEVGLFVGSSAAVLTRAGKISFSFSPNEPERFATNTAGDVDVNSHFFGFGLNGADGMSVTISRTNGNWQYLIDGVLFKPNTAFNGSGTPVDPNGAYGSPNLDALSDLVVGIYGINRNNSASETYSLDSFSASVQTGCAEGSCCGTNCYGGIGTFNTISDHLFMSVVPSTFGDINVDGVVNYDDFHLWKIAYVPDGAGASVLGAVPEPTTCGLCLIAAAAIFAGLVLMRTPRFAPS